MRKSLIEFENVHKSFGDNPVLAGADLCIYEGEITTIIGISGVGKSVLIKHIIGLLVPDKGRILFEGMDLSQMRKSDKKALKKKLSYMFQGGALFDSMTVFENVALPLTEKTRLPKKEIRSRVREKMHQLDLHDVDDLYPSQLSGGMKKRVALARALVTDPEIVLFDEPTTGLDPIRKNAVHHMISDYQKKFGFTGVVVSHDIPDVFYISQRVAMLHEGKIVFQGPPADTRNAKNPTVKKFIRGLESRHNDTYGLENQPHGEKRFQEELSRMQRHKVAFSMILFTAENMDEVNDKVGYENAFKALNTFAVELRKGLRITDTCSWYGLNKIMVVLPATDLKQAKMVCDKLSIEMNGKLVAPEPSPGSVCLWISFGFAEAEETSKVEAVLSQAESNKETFCKFCV